MSAKRKQGQQKNRSRSNVQIASTLGSDYEIVRLDPFWTGITTMGSGEDHHFGDNGDDAMDENAPSTFWDNVALHFMSVMEVEEEQQQEEEEEDQGSGRGDNDKGSKPRSYLLTFSNMYQFTVGEEDHGSDKKALIRDANQLLRQWKETVRTLNSRAKVRTSRNKAKRVKKEGEGGSNEEEELFSQSEIANVFALLSSKETAAEMLNVVRYAAHMTNPGEINTLKLLISCLEFGIIHLSLFTTDSYFAELTEDMRINIEKGMEFYIVALMGLFSTRHLRDNDRRGKLQPTDIENITGELHFMLDLIDSALESIAVAAFDISVNSFAIHHLYGSIVRHTSSIVLDMIDRIRKGHRRYNLVSSLKTSLVRLLCRSVKTNNSAESMSELATRFNLGIATYLIHKLHSFDFDAMKDILLRYAMACFQSDQTFTFKLIHLLATELCKLSRTIPSSKLCEPVQDTDVMLSRILHEFSIRFPTVMACFLPDLCFMQESTKSAIRKSLIDIMGGCLLAIPIDSLDSDTRSLFVGILCARIRDRDSFVRRRALQQVSIFCRARLGLFNIQNYTDILDNTAARIMDRVKAVRIAALVALADIIGFNPFITNLDIARARDRTSKARKLVTEFDRCVQMARQHFGDSFPTIFEKIRATHQHLLLESTVHTENQDEESIALYDKLNSVGGVLALGDFIANNEHMENDELDISCIRQVFQASENTKVENDPNLFNMGKGLLLTHTHKQLEELYTKSLHVEDFIAALRDDILPHIYDLLANMNADKALFDVETIQKAKDILCGNGSTEEVSGCFDLNVVQQLKMTVLSKCTNILKTLEIDWTRLLKCVNVTEETPQAEQMISMVSEVFLSRFQGISANVSFTMTDRFMRFINDMNNVPQVQADLSGRLLTCWEKIFVHIRMHRGNVDLEVIIFELLNRVSLILKDYSMRTGHMESLDLENSLLSLMRGIMLLSNVYESSMRTRGLSVLQHALSAIDLRNTETSALRLSIIQTVLRIVGNMYSEKSGKQYERLLNFVRSYMSANMAILLRHCRKECLSLIYLLNNRRNIIYSVLAQLESEFFQFIQIKSEDEHDASQDSVESFNPKEIEVDEMCNFIVLVGDIVMKNKGIWKDFAKQRWKSANDDNAKRTDAEFEEEEGQEDTAGIDHASDYMRDYVEKQNEEEFQSAFVQEVLSEGFLSRYIRILQNVLREKGVPERLMCCAIASLGKYMLQSVHIASSNISLIVETLEQAASASVVINCLVVIADMMYVIPNIVEEYCVYLFKHLSSDNPPQVRKTALILIGNMYIKKVTKSNHQLHNVARCLLRGDGNNGAGELYIYARTILLKVFENESKRVDRVLYGIMLSITGDIGHSEDCDSENAENGRLLRDSAETGGDNLDDDEFQALMSILIDMVPNKKDMCLFFSRAFMDNQQRALAISRVMAMLVPCARSVALLQNFLHHNVRRLFAHIKLQHSVRHVRTVHDNLVAVLKKGAQAGLPATQKNQQRTKKRSACNFTGQSPVHAERTLEETIGLIGVALKEVINTKSVPVSSGKGASKRRKAITVDTDSSESEEDSLDEDSEEEYSFTQD